MGHYARLAMILVAMCLACSCAKEVDHSNLQTSKTPPKQPPCEDQFRFFQGLPPEFPIPQSDKEVEFRLFRTYGAVLVTRGGAIPPPLLVFPNDASVSRWQSSLETDRARLGNLVVELQVPALRALQDARVEAKRKGLEITPNGPDSSKRTYANTVELWKSRVEPGLNHWVKKGLLTSQQASALGDLPPLDQVSEILRMEETGMFFNRDFSRTILSSVAPPGASQHLTLLAFDVKEHENSVVRSILARHGWFQTIPFDLPHFTYLGDSEQQLKSLGLRIVSADGRQFWVPAVDCGDLNPREQK